METIDNSEWDVVISGTGLPQSLLALALSRSGKKILHLDHNEYYGGAEAAFSLNEAEEWAAKNTGEAESSTKTFSHASITRADMDDSTEKKLASSRAYSLALAPQLIYARSNLIGGLITSQTTNQLEFLAVGSWFMVPFAAGGSSTLIRVPSSREDIFRDTSLNVRAKRSLMKFLRYVTTYEEQEDWDEKKENSFRDELQHTFGLDVASHGPLLALALSPSAAADTPMGIALPRIAQHLRGIGILGPGFSAVLPKWGGLAEIVQVACRACAVGGGVYVLGRGVTSATQSFKDKLTLELSEGEKVTARWLVGSNEDVPESMQSAPAADFPDLRTAKSISIVSSSLTALFPPTSEGGVKPEGAVVVVETGDASCSPVHILVHTSDAGECPSGQCVLYASTTSTKGFDALEKAIESLLQGVGEQPEPQVLWKMQYFQLTPPTASLEVSGADAGNNVVLMPPLAPDVVLEDRILSDVKEVWKTITSEREEEFLKFETREGGSSDEEVA